MNANKLERNFTVPFRMVFLMWVVYYAQFLISIDLGNFGILPRTREGLIGILTAPLIHGNLKHLISNTIPLVVCGGLLFWYYPRIARRVYWQSYLFTGFLVWVFARQFYHIGSSGLVYALGYFLVFFGLFLRDIKTLMVSLLVVALYGGLFTNVFVIDNRISWESHLMGAVVGAVQAFLLRNVGRNVS
jgi:membrane associated rhomboid family serine protease